MPWRKETDPELCKLLALVHRQGKRAFAPGFYGEIKLSAPIHDGHGGKVRCELVDTAIEDLTLLWKSGNK